MFTEFNEFVKKFQADKQYTEQEVNDIILEQYEDYCQVRRALIDEGIMKRKKQIYKLVSNNYMLI